MKTPARAAAAHMSWKWNRPTRRRTVVQDESSASDTIANVSKSMMRLRPSTARWKRIPA